MNNIPQFTIVGQVGNELELNWFITTSQLQAGHTYWYSIQDAMPVQFTPAYDGWIQLVPVNGIYGTNRIEVFASKSNGVQVGYTYQEVDIHRPINNAFVIAGSIGIGVVISVGITSFISGKIPVKKWFKLLKNKVQGKGKAMNYCMLECKKNNNEELNIIDVELHNKCKIKCNKDWELFKNKK